MDQSITVRRRRVAHRAAAVAVAVMMFGALASACTTSTGNRESTSVPSSATGGASAGSPAGDGSTIGTGASPTGSSVVDDPTTTVTTTQPSTPVSSTSTTSTSTTTTTAAPTTTVLVISQGGIVLVANASNVKGAASQLTKSLAAVGYATVKATNAAGYEQSLDVSKVYFVPEAYPVAYSVAKIMGVAVAPMPTPPPIQYALDGLSGANVVVMLGRDLAGHPIPGLPTG